MTRYRISRRTVALFAAGAGLAALAIAGGEAANAVLRALAIVATLGLGAAALRWRRSHPEAPLMVSVVERHALGREMGVAVIAAEDRRLLVGFGPAGVALVCELGSTEARAP